MPLDLDNLLIKKNTLMTQMHKIYNTVANISAVIDEKPRNRI